MRRPVTVFNAQAHFLETEENGMFNDLFYVGQKIGSYVPGTISPIEVLCDWISAQDQETLDSYRLKMAEVNSLRNLRAGL